MFHLPPELAYQLLSRFTVLSLGIARSFHLTPHQLVALVLLTAGGPQHFKELRESLGVPKSSLTFIIDVLEKRGLVKRRQDPSDRRQWLVTLTAKGRELSRAVAQRRAEGLTPLFDMLSSSGSDCITVLIRELRDSGEGPPVTTG